MDTKFLNLLPKSKDSIYVNFTNRGLSRVVKSENSLQSTSPDRSSVIQVAKVLSDVKISPTPPVGFKSVPEFVGVDYVGYVIEKQRLDRNTGQWITTDEYRVIGSSMANFKDSRVAYGNVYRYRMKSVVSVTVKKTKVSYESLELVESIKEFEKDAIKESLQSRQIALENIDRITNLGLSAKSSSGTKPTMYNLLSGLRIKATEDRTTIDKVAVGLPMAQSQDLRRLKNLRVEDANLLRGSISQEKLQKLVNDVLKPIEEELVEYESVFYESRPSKGWTIVNVAERVPPPPPSAIKITPNSIKKEIIVSWLPPVSPQRDIKKILLYKRGAVGGTWSLVSADKEVDVDKDGFVDDRTPDQLIPVEKGYFVDKDVEFYEKYIYALVSVDIHGTQSFMSTQIQAQLNPNFNVEKKEKNLKWISGSGARPEEKDVIFKKFKPPPDLVVAKKSVTLSLRPEFNEVNKKILIRITSLDTHESREFNVSLKNVNLDEPQG